jgi:phosphopantothenoylcysteine decarboxylase/phosphopantothenate--cysteine ligase
LHRLLHAADGSAGFDALVMAAAVADFRPTASAERKLERGAGLTLELEPTPDVLGQIARLVRGTDKTGEQTYATVVPTPVLVGFAAETGSLDRAVEKLRRKGVDLLVANDVAEPGSGFGTDTNRVSILAADGTRDDLPLQRKRAVADAILDRVVTALGTRDAATLDERSDAAQTGP